LDIRDMTTATPPTAEVPIETKLAFLRHPDSFPEPTRQVDAIETHMSWVFLTDRYAYKLKKPVHYELLDFRTLNARRFYCDEELRLNRRLAPDVYLGVIALTVTAAGLLQFGGTGPVADWLVWMHRLPANRMLDHAIAAGSVTANDMMRIAGLLVEFYDRCVPVALTQADYRAHLDTEIRRSATALSVPAYGLPADMVDRICLALHTALQRLAAQLDQRIDAGKVVEGHGDLRPEHVCLGPVPAVIDCLEFARRLRIVDIVDELASLALECERLGAADIGAIPLRVYTERSGDMAPADLIHFYQSIKACMRARIAALHLNEEKFRYRAEWRNRAIDYLRLAERHLGIAPMLRERSEREQPGD
jgi:aminoglycoside phosphotransferase family enzyme